MISWDTPELSAAMQVEPEVAKPVRKPKPAKRFLVFEERDVEAKRKTRVVHVKSAITGFLVGTISWYAPWRRYAFMPAGATIFDVNCLREVAGCINLLMEERHP